MGFLKLSYKVCAATKTKGGYQICFYSQIYTKPTTKVIENANKFDLWRNSLMLF
ncbi:hypothetical protein VBZ67_01750 [Campylobacter concisus]